MRIADAIVESANYTRHHQRTPYEHEIKATAEKMAALLGSGAATSVEASGVAELVATMGQVPPNSRPPFKTCLVEWVETRDLNYRFHDGTPRRLKRSGAFVHVLPSDEAEFIPVSLDVHDDLAMPGLGIRSVYKDDCWSDTKLIAAPDVEDALVGIGKGREGFAIDRKGLALSCIIALRPSLIAFSLMNCSNVSTVDVAVPSKLQRARIRKGKSPILTYKTLVIAPNEPKGKKTGLEYMTADPSMPLHLQRGHFKDYREGAGLFGRSKGVFWWSPHARGSIECGEVQKNYVVEEPRK